MDAIFKLDQISEVAEALWESGKKHRVWAFHAPMGSGKTTFISALCKYLGVQHTVSSPSFAIVNEYNSTAYGNLYHMDWYRLKDEAEAIGAGIEELLVSGSYCFIEWPSIAIGLLPEDALVIHLEALDECTRRIFIPLNS